MIIKRILLAILVLLAAINFALPASYGEEKPLKFRDVIHKLESLKGRSGTGKDSVDDVTGTSGDKRLDLQEEYYHEVAGKIVEGEGVVIGLSFGRRDRAKLEILSAGNTPSKGFNAVVVVHTKDVGSIREGSYVYFKGMIERMSLLRGLSLDIRGIQIRPAVKKK